MSHPKHPAVVHIPITTTLFSAGLDAVYFLSRHGATSTYVASACMMPPILPPIAIPPHPLTLRHIVKSLDIALSPATFPILSYYTTIITLLFAVPAIATGAYEFMPVLQRDGLSSKKAKVGVLHALMSDVCILTAAYNWWTRRQTPGFVPSGTNILLSAVVALPVTIWAASLGGSLVFVYGMGLGSGKAKSKKSQ